ncbi:Hypothetical predicted protein [Lecanosticta acicola]|uniref:Uncharacterized protein n=1 Tax=Lecanosticta acicola TaxID=111012 RepID=A0AAI8Z715_9PEZI|nr:Hypothetical predicted protein [Lecanosticta acicola]
MAEPDQGITFKVFDVVELLEKILLGIPASTILTEALPTCRQFKTTIDRSIKLQRELFFIRDASVGEQYAVDVQRCAVIRVSRETEQFVKDQHLHVTAVKPNGLLYNMLPLLDPVERAEESLVVADFQSLSIPRRSKLQAPSYCRMYITQPPIVKAQVTIHSKKKAYLSLVTSMSPAAFSSDTSAILLPLQRTSTGVVVAFCSSIAGCWML